MIIFDVFFYFIIFSFSFLTELNMTKNKQQKKSIVTAAGNYCDIFIRYEMILMLVYLDECTSRRDMAVNVCEPVKCQYLILK